MKIAGRVVDALGKPVPWVSVTTPSTPDSTTQPNFVYTTDNDGRFTSDGLPPGTYSVMVGGIYRTEDGERSPTAVKDAPGVYIPVPIVIRDEQAVPELNLRPVESVRFTATFFGPLPKDDPKADAAKTPPANADPAALAAAYRDGPTLNVKGNYNGVEWASQFSFAAAEERPGTYTVHVPKGLTDATLYLGLPRWFRLDPKSPELFGTGYRLGRVDADRLDIQIRPHHRTTIRVVVSDPRPASFKVTARYVREADMKAAGVSFDPMPPLSADPDGKFPLWVLPGAELEITATAAGGATANARATLADGENREVPLRFNN